MVVFFASVYLFLITSDLVPSGGTAGENKYTIWYCCLMYKIYNTKNVKKN